MKKLLAFLTLMIFLVACAPQPTQPQVAPQPAQPRGGIPQIEVVPPQKALPEKPEYEPPPTEPMPAQAPIQATQTVPSVVREFTIEADDYGFYPSGDISVKTGESVKIIFKIKSVGVYYGGLQVKSDSPGIFDTGTLKPGDNGLVEFVADKTFTYTSWWPSLARKKKTATVTVT